MTADDGRWTAALSSAERSFFERRPSAVRPSVVQTRAFHAAAVSTLGPACLISSEAVSS